MPSKLLTAAGISFLIIQIYCVTISAFNIGKHFCWAPHNTQVKYQLTCYVNDSTLNDKQIFARYGLHAVGWEAHHEQNIKDLIIAAERQNLFKGKVSIVYNYSVNGKQYETWRYESKK